MVFKVTLILITFLLTACGSHKQELWSSLNQLKKNDSKVTNPNELIQQAISRGDLASVKKYIEDDGVDINLIGKGGSSLLILSIVAKQYNIIEYFLSKNVDLALRTPDGRDAFAYAGRDKVINSLLKGEVLTSNDLMKILIKDAIKKLNVEMAAWILGKDVDVNYKLRGKTALISLCLIRSSNKEKIIEIANLILSLPGVDTKASVRRKTAYMLAVKNKHKEVANLILRYEEASKY